MGRRPSWGEPLEGVPPQAEAALHAIDEDEGRKGAERAFGLVVATCEVKDPRAVDCLAKDRGAFLVYDDFPHRRTSLLNIDVASVVARAGRIDRRTFVVCSRLDATLYAYHPRLVNGYPYGTAIRARYFRHDSPAALKFIKWFKSPYRIDIS